MARLTARHAKYSLTISPSYFELSIRSENSDTPFLRRLFVLHSLSEMTDSINTQQTGLAGASAVIRQYRSCIGVIVVRSDRAHNPYFSIKDVVGFCKFDLG
jgi:hypothetical protein